MLDHENIDLLSAQTGDILIFACRECVDADENKRTLWSYVIRVENNSLQRIRLLKKDFCITDCTGRNYYDLTDGFHGELPDLEPGEYFEYEDTAITDGSAAVLYGSCIAQNEKGQMINIKLPLIELSSEAEYSALKAA